MECPRTQKKIEATLKKMYPDQTIVVNKFWNDFGEWRVNGKIGEQEFYECGEGPCGPISGVKVAKQIASGLGVSWVPWSECPEDIAS
jgi:hypothetical protein